MAVESTRAVRVRARELSPTGLRRLAVATAAALYLIVISGSLVRLTSSGLGSESWPGCEAGSFFPEESHHAFVEFGNRVFSLFPIVLSLALWIAAWRASGLPRWVTWVAALTFLGTIGQAPLGMVTIYSDLHPLLVMSHFLLALVVLAGAIVPRNVRPAVHVTQRGRPDARHTAIQSASESTIGKRLNTRLPNSTNAWWLSSGKNDPASQPGHDSQPSPDEVSRTRLPEITIRYSATTVATASRRRPVDDSSRARTRTARVDSTAMLRV